MESLRSAEVGLLVGAIGLLLEVVGTHISHHLVSYAVELVVFLVHDQAGPVDPLDQPGGVVSQHFSGTVDLP